MMSLQLVLGIPFSELLGPSGAKNAKSSDRIGVQLFISGETTSEKLV